VTDDVGLLREEVAALRAELDALRSGTTIRCERLELVEPDGTVRLVIANQTRFPQQLSMAGWTVEHPRPYTGMLFFNDDGEECGGLVWGGKAGPEDTWQQNGLLSFDQFHQDQVIALV
jgi:hypothetical protein